MALQFENQFGPGNQKKAKGAANGVGVDNRKKKSKDPLKNAFGMGASEPMGGMQMDAPAMDFGMGAPAANPMGGGGYEDMMEKSLWTQEQDQEGNILPLAEASGDQGRLSMGTMGGHTTAGGGIPGMSSMGAQPTGMAGFSGAASNQAQKDWDLANPFAVHGMPWAPGQGPAPQVNQQTQPSSETYVDPDRGFINRPAQEGDIVPGMDYGRAGIVAGPGGQPDSGSYQPIDFPTDESGRKMVMDDGRQRRPHNWYGQMDDDWFPRPGGPAQPLPQGEDVIYGMRGGQQGQQGGQPDMGGGLGMKGGGGESSTAGYEQNKRAYEDWMMEQTAPMRNKMWEDTNYGWNQLQPIIDSAADKSVDSRGGRSSFAGGGDPLSAALGGPQADFTGGSVAGPSTDSLPTTSQFDQEGVPSDSDYASWYEEEGPGADLGQTAGIVAGDENPWDEGMGDPDDPTGPTRPPVKRPPTGGDGDERWWLTTSSGSQPFALGQPGQFIAVVYTDADGNEAKSKEDSVGTRYGWNMVANKGWVWGPEPASEDKPATEPPISQPPVSEGGGIIAHPNSKKKDGTRWGDDTPERWLSQGYTKDPETGEWTHPSDKAGTEPKVSRPPSPSDEGVTDPRIARGFNPLTGRWTDEHTQTLKDLNKSDVNRVPDERSQWKKGDLTDEQIGWAAANGKYFGGVSYPLNADADKMLPKDKEEWILKMQEMQGLLGELGNRPTNNTDEWDKAYEKIWGWGPTDGIREYTPGGKPVFSEAVQRRKDIEEKNKGDALKEVSDTKKELLKGEDLGDYLDRMEKAGLGTREEISARLQEQAEKEVARKKDGSKLETDSEFKERTGWERKKAFQKVGDAAYEKDEDAPAEVMPVAPVKEELTAEEAEKEKEVSDWEKSSGGKKAIAAREKFSDAYLKLSSFHNPGRVPTKEEEALLTRLENEMHQAMNDSGWTTARTKKEKAAQEEKIKANKAIATVDGQRAIYNFDKDRYESIGDDGKPDGRYWDEAAIFQGRVPRWISDEVAKKVVAPKGIDLSEKHKEKAWAREAERKAKETRPRQQYQDDRRSVSRPPEQEQWRKDAAAQGLLNMEIYKKHGWVQNPKTGEWEEPKSPVISKPPREGAWEGWGSISPDRKEPLYEKYGKDRVEKYVKENNGNIPPFAEWDKEIQDKPAEKKPEQVTVDGEQYWNMSDRGKPGVPEWGMFTDGRGNVMGIDPPADWHRKQDEPASKREGEAAWNMFHGDLNPRGRGGQEFKRIQEELGIDKAYGLKMRKIDEKDTGGGISGMTGGRGSSRVTTFEGPDGRRFQRSKLNGIDVQGKWTEVGKADPADKFSEVGDAAYGDEERRPEGYRSDNPDDWYDTIDPIEGFGPVEEGDQAPEADAGSGEDETTLLGDGKDLSSPEISTPPESSDVIGLTNKEKRERKKIDKRERDDYNLAPELEGVPLDVLQDTEGNIDYGGNMIVSNAGGLTKADMRRRGVKPSQIQALVNNEIAKNWGKYNQAAGGTGLQAQQGMNIDKGTYAQRGISPLVQAMLGSRKAQVDIPWQYAMQHAGQVRDRRELAHQLGLQELGMTQGDFYADADDRLSREAVDRQLLNSIYNTNAFTWNT